MDKKTILSALILLVVSFSAGAQQYDVLDQVKADWRKAAAM